ncbi:MAG: hypothetical protein SGCHY_001214, partial [Lobulomycetales sp.]
QVKRTRIKAGIFATGISLYMLYLADESLSSVPTPKKKLPDQKNQMEQATPQE